MNVYDFDDTIFDGDSSKLFLLHCIRVKKALVFMLPVQALSLALNKAHLMSIERAKGICFSVLRFFRDKEALVDGFCRQERHRLTAWYQAARRPDDVIISASPSFLVMKFLPDVPPRNIICTDMDIRTGKIAGRNCKGAEKIPRFLARFPGGRIDAFYSDSLSDSHMAGLAKEAFLVDNRKRRIAPFPLR